MIPSEVYALACAIGKCGADDQPDNECISIAFQMIGHLKDRGWQLTPSNAGGEHG